MRNENPSNSHKYQRCHQEENERKKKKENLRQTDINFHPLFVRYEIEKLFFLHDRL